MLSDDILRPVKIFGIVLFAIGFVGIIFDFSYLNDPELSTGFKIFGVIISMWHLLGGIGILLKKAWGFYIFKSYLYILFLGIPIGTYIAFKMLDYIKRNNLKEYFI
jgi:hypothetical protein